MSTARDRREGRRSTARTMAETHSSGYSTTTLKLPEGMKFWEPQEGLNIIDVVPFFAGVDNPNARKGEIHFERTFFSYRKIGVDEKSYICSSKTFGKRDPIQEFRQQQARDPKADTDYLKELEPRQRQIFLVFDHKAPDNRIQIWEVSFHLFGKQLLDRIKLSPEELGWDFFYYPDETGFALQIGFKKKSWAGSNFLETAVIDFLPRKHPLPDDFQPENHKICLDECLIETPYEELKNIFLGLPRDVEKEEQGGKEREVDHQDERREAPTESRQEERRTEEKPDETPRMTKAEHIAAGYKAFVGNRKRSDNPWKKGTDEYEFWQDGWLDAADKEPSPTKREEQKEKTADMIGLKKGSIVSYRGQRNEVVRISEDGLSVTLIDPEEEVTKGISVKDLSPWASEGNGKSETKREEPRKEETAAKKDASGDDEKWDAKW